MDLGPMKLLWITIVGLSWGPGRMKEMETHADMLKKCKHLKTWLKSLDSPEKEGSDDPARVAWVAWGGSGITVFLF